MKRVLVEGLGAWWTIPSIVATLALRWERAGWAELARHDGTSGDPCWIYFQGGSEGRLHLGPWSAQPFRVLKQHRARGGTGYPI